MGKGRNGFSEIPIGRPLEIEQDWPGNFGREERPGRASSVGFRGIETAEDENGFRGNRGLLFVYTELTEHIEVAGGSRFVLALYRLERR